MEYLRNWKRGYLWCPSASAFPSLFPGICFHFEVHLTRVTASITTDTTGRTSLDQLNTGALLRRGKKKTLTFNGTIFIAFVGRAGFRTAFYGNFVAHDPIMNEDEAFDRSDKAFVEHLLTLVLLLHTKRTGPLFVRIHHIININKGRLVENTSKQEGLGQNQLPPIKWVNFLFLGLFIWHCPRSRKPFLFRLTTWRNKIQ